MAKDDQKKKKNGDQIKKDIEKMKKDIGVIEKVTGTKVFKKVMKVFGRVQKSAETGEDIANSTKETVKELNTAKKKFVDECVKKWGNDEEFRGVCEERWTREIGKGNSTILTKIKKRSFEKIIYKELPDSICKRIEKCAKEMEKN